MRLHERYILGVGLLSLVGVLLVVFYVKTPEPPFTRGVHTKEQQAVYEPDANGKFRCPISGEIIDFEMVNDDYCDCKDGGDEPGTSACAAGLFFCNHDTAGEGLDWVFSTSRVNDGICDCADGSDEYAHNKVLSFRLDDNILKKLGRGMSPCKDRRPLEDYPIAGY